MGRFTIFFIQIKQKSIHFFAKKLMCLNPSTFEKRIKPKTIIFLRALKFLLVQIHQIERHFFMISGDLKNKMISDPTDY